MDQIEKVTAQVLTANTRTTERECPRCDAMLILNENEQCYECLKCGYIDCGDDK